MDFVTFGPQSGTVSTNPLPRSDDVMRCDTRDVKELSAHVLIILNVSTADATAKLIHDVFGPFSWILHEGDVKFGTPLS